MELRLPRASLREPLEASLGWEVVDHLRELEAPRDQMTQPQRDVVALADVFEHCQWDGVYLALANLGPTAFSEALGAAERLGHPEMAATLAEALSLVPGGWSRPDALVSEVLMAHYTDSAVRDTFMGVEDAWDTYGLSFTDYMSAHESEFFLT